MELKHIATRTGRLSSFLKEEMGMSSGLVNKLKWQEKILVNGVSRHNDYTVQPGDVGFALWVEVTGTGEYNGTVTSSKTSAVQGTPLITTVTDLH